MLLSHFQNPVLNEWCKSLLPQDDRDYNLTSVRQTNKITTLINICFPQFKITSQHCFVFRRHISWKMAMLTAVSVIYLSSSRKMWMYLKTGTHQFLLHPFKFVTTLTSNVTLSVPLWRCHNITHASIKYTRISVNTDLGDLHMSLSSRINLPPTYPLS